MTWGRRGRLLAVTVLACLSIPLLGGQAAWAEPFATDAHTSVSGYAFATGSHTVTTTLASTHPYEAVRREHLCGGSATVTSSSSYLNVTPGVAASTSISAINCGTGKLLYLAFRASSTAGATSAAAGDPYIFAWQPDEPGAPSPSPYPSPSPSPVVSVQPGPTHYAYPTPQAGGGDVDSCASDTCTVTLAAGTTVGLSDEQALALWLFLGTLLLIALTGFLLRHGRALRV